MIISLPDGSYFRARYLICLRNSVDAARFLRRGKVKAGTYAGKLLANLHDRIFNRSLELKRDYAQYYSVEYGTFEEYLHKRLLLPPENIREVATQFSKCRDIIYFHPGYAFLQEDYGREFLEKLLEPRRRT